MALHPIDASMQALAAAAPADKVAAAEAALAALEQIGAGDAPIVSPPLQPARPDKPVLAPPGAVPKRRLGSDEGRIALLHAIAHIEFNAIDLAFDMAARFHGDIAKMGLDSAAFIADWVRIGAEEAYHFGLICNRLAEYGAAYGDLPAHNGLWEAAEATAHDVAARLAIAPMILEARGLDVTPGMIDRLTDAGDEKSADILQIIYNDEIGHVACGERWFHAICTYTGEDQTAAFRRLREKYFNGVLKPPFNHSARAEAGLPRTYYDDAFVEE